MKCETCNADVLESFRFCHKCGKSLKKTETAAEQQPSVSKAPAKALSTFEDFRKTLSSQRQESIKDKGKKKKTDTPSEVMMNIGSMKLLNGDLKPVKGKIMIVRVPVSIRKLELLRKGIEKHAAHDRTFHPFEDYALLYPDGTEILTLPGQPTQIFQLDKYKEDIGKPYHRRTLYLIERETLEMSRNIKTQVEGKDMVIMLKHVLQFITGAEDIPAIGFTPRPTLHFSHDVRSIKEKDDLTNTCANILRIPVANMSDYSQFSDEFTFCMMNSPGFGVI